MLTFSIILIFAPVACGLKETEVKNGDFSRAFNQLLKRVYTETPFESVFLQRKEAADCIDEDFQRYFELPVISYGAGKTIYLKGNYSSEMLAVLCMRQMDDKELLGQLAINLQHMRNIRIIVIVKKNFQRQNQESIRGFFTECKRLQLVNINLLHEDCFRTGLFHSYTDFPEFKVETRKLQINASFFTERLRNLHGKILITLPDQQEPRTMLYTDAKGRQRMSGYIGKLMHAFEAQYNCVFMLKYPYNLSNEHVFHLSVLREISRNGSIDIGASISTAQYSKNMHEFSATIELSRWNIMLPIESPVPTNLLLVHFLRTDILLVFLMAYWPLSLLLTLRWRLEGRRVVCVRPLLRDICCNDVSLRGLLWQPFKMPRRSILRHKIIYFMVSLGGLFFSNFVSANIMKFLTASLSSQPITTFDGLLQSKVKIRLPAQDTPIVKFFRGEEFWQKYQAVFEIVKSNKEFLRQRLALELPFGYSIATSSWRVVEEQQKHFAQKLYRIAPELYICNFLVFTLPMNENSIYKEPMNRLIGRIQDVGLLKHWLRCVFYDMVATKRLSFEDKSKPRIFQQLNVGDFFWIWILFISGLGISIVVFIVERIAVKLRA